MRRFHQIFSGETYDSHQMSGGFQAVFPESGERLQNIPEDKCIYRKTTMSRIISENIAGLRGISENHLGFGGLRRFLDNTDLAFFEAQDLAMSNNLA